MKTKEELREDFLKTLTCDILCGNGSGKEPKEHMSLCPYVRKIRRPFDYLWLALLRDNDWMPRFIVNCIDYIRYFEI